MRTRHSSLFSLIAALLLSLGSLTTGCALDAETTATETDAPALTAADDSHAVDESASWVAGDTDPSSARAIDQGFLPTDPNSARAIEDGIVPAAPNSARAIEDGIVPAAPNGARAIEDGIVPAAPNSARAIENGVEVLNQGPSAPGDDSAAQVIDDPAAPIATRDDGESCTADWECQSDFCVNGVCREPSAN